MGEDINAGEYVLNGASGDDILIVFDSGQDKINDFDPALELIMGIGVPVDHTSALSAICLSVRVPDCR